MAIRAPDGANKKKTLTQKGFQYSVVSSALAPNLLSLKCCSYFQESDTLQRAGFFWPGLLT